MTFTDWTAKLVEERIIEMADICQRVADKLNQARQIRLVTSDCGVTEIQPDIAPTTVTSEKCTTDWRAPDARPQIDPFQPKSRVLEPRSILVRHSEKHRSPGMRQQKKYESDPLGLKIDCGRYVD